MASEPKPRLSLAIAGVAVALCGSAVWWFWFAGPPQLDADEQVFDAVDALFTAVRARDERLLGDCERRLRAYEEAGKISSPVKVYLDGVIETARSGKWRPAAERLYDFMKAQRIRLTAEPTARG